MTTVRFLASLSLFLTLLSAQAQERVLGTWKVFNPNRSTIVICDAGDRVYNASGKGFFSYEKQSGAIQLYDKNTGLSDVNIKTMAYHPEAKTLVVAYTNSNLDIIENGTDIYNIPDFKTENTSGSFLINHISFNGNKCYISSNVGISEINLEKKEISNTYIIGNGGASVNVYASASDGSKIYAATAQGLKYAPLSSGNLQNFNAWQTYDTAQGLQKVAFSNVETLNGKVYASSIGVGFRPDTIFRLNAGNWQPVYYNGNDSVINLNVWNGTLYFSTWDNDSTKGKNGKIDANDVLSVNPSVGHVRPTGWFFSEGHSWEGDYWAGLYKNNQMGYLENVVPNGPFSSDAFDLSISNSGALYVTAGGVDGSWGMLYNSAGFYKYENGSWKNINQYTQPALTDRNDLLSSVTSPNGKTYVASFRKGLIEYINSADQVNVYDRSNSPIEPNAGDLNRDAITALAVDNNGVLWMTNAGASKPIKGLKPDGSWVEYSIPYSVALMKKIVIDRNGQFWMPVRRNGEGLLVWDNNGTLDNLSDDKSRLLTTGDGYGALPDGQCFCVAEDKEGNIWVGTNAGIGVFYCPGSVLTNGCDADQIKVERDGYIGYLFGTESVRAIAVDAANRKWVGTTNGLWLISADGKDELLKFTVDNSPLPDNQITDIVIDDRTGEVFISTIGGLVSYQGDAMGACEDCDGALVYPNPVKPDYDGPIAIKGLVEDAYVKITDVNGTLIYQGKANGTQMIWNGKGYKGERAKSGVYLVFSSTDKGKEKQVAKILVTN